MYDFSSGFGVINKAFENIGRQNELAFKQQTLADLGKDLNSGNYASAAQRAIASGDAGLGISILGLGQKAQEKAAEAEWLRRNGGAMGMGADAAVPTGGAPLTRLGQGITPTRGVQVANSEEDVQRLEAEASGLTQAGQRSEPRGLRNNNPGNIETGRFAATVQGFQGSDGRFAQYATPEQGIQAADKLLTSYAGRGLNTVAGIVNRWAPPTENNTGAYVAQVAKELGVDPNQPLDMASPEVRQRLIAAKIRVENGKQPYAEDVFQRALNPNWNREVASFEGGGAQPVQVAQAPPQPGQPVADAPAPGAAQAQGFVIPGTSPQQTQSILSDPAVRRARERFNSAPTERTRAIAKQDLDLALADAKTRIDEGGPLTQEGRRLSNEAARRKLDEGDQTSDIKEYNLYRRQAADQGKSPDDFTTWQRANKAAGRTQITNTNAMDAKAEGKFDETMAVGQAKRYTDYIAEGDVAQGRLADIQTLRETSRRLGSQGSSANLKALIGPYAESLNIPVDGLSDIQLYESITQRLAPTLRAAGSGSTSDIEFKGFQRAIGPLSNTPAAREMILDTFEAASRNDLARAEIASRLARKEINRGQAEKEIRALPNPLEGFRKYREANPDAVGQAIKESAQRQILEKNGPPKISSPEMAGKLPSGTEFIDPNGVKRRVP